MKSKLWNSIEENAVYKTDQTLYQQHLLEQYKLYVEMADRISQRRNSTNVFFLTLSTSLISALGFVLDAQSDFPGHFRMLIAGVGIVISIAWWWILRSYRNLNSAKYKVVGQLEAKLPSSPYWSAEWSELVEGKSIKKYLPLSKLEQFVPIVFVIGYIIILLVT